MKQTIKRHLNKRKYTRKLRKLRKKYTRNMRKATRNLLKKSRRFMKKTYKLQREASSLVVDSSATWWQPGEAELPGASRIKRDSRRRRRPRRREEAEVKRPRTRPPPRPWSRPHLAAPVHTSGPHSSPHLQRSQIGTDVGHQSIYTM